MRTALGIIAILFSLGSALFVFAALGDLVGGDSKTGTGILLGLLVFFLGTSLTSAWFAKRMLGQSSESVKARLQRHEQAILDLAKVSGGRVTLTEVAAHTELSLEEAEAALDRLCKTSICDTHYTGDHAAVYAFPGLMSASKKATAVDPLA